MDEQEEITLPKNPSLFSFNIFSMKTNIRKLCPKVVSRTGFTLVELIVVIAILGIISAIGTQSFMSYLESSRDTTRASDLVTISNFLKEYGKVNGSYPNPDGAQAFYYQSTSLPVWYQ